MRLLDVNTLQLVDFVDVRSAPKYAILSHTWDVDEVLFADITQARAGMTSKKGFRKVKYLCQQAKLDGFSYAWIDTCCIDKTSSAELSEAINSMYEWYRKSAVCYVYLQGYSHVSGSHDNFSKGAYQQFKFHRWFSRGWTLQELIAPEEVVFYDTNWHLVGPLHSIVQAVSARTNIDASVLTHEELPSSLSVAKRMSWAARRETTRAEDEAYALLGLFDVNMPLLYGEGSRAFLRLQEEIIRRNPDLSILAWNAISIQKAGTWVLATKPLLFAPSPQYFEQCGDVVRVPGHATSESWLTNHGLHTTMQICEGTSNELYGILNCREACNFDEVIALHLSKASQEKSDTDKDSYVVTTRTVGRVSRVCELGPAIYQTGQTRAINIARGLPENVGPRPTKRRSPKVFKLWFTRNSSSKNMLGASRSSFWWSIALYPASSWDKQTMTHDPKDRQQVRCGVITRVPQRWKRDMAICFAYTRQGVQIAISEFVNPNNEPRSSQLQAICEAMAMPAKQKGGLKARAQCEIDGVMVTVSVRLQRRFGELVLVADLEVEEMKDSTADAV